MWIEWIAALLPIIILLLMMVRFHWGASRAGPLGWFASVAVGYLHFGMNLEILAWSQAKAFFLSLDVLLIVWGAFLLYRVADEAGSIDALRAWMPSLTQDKGIQGLLIAWPFASFLQGVGGFGVPVAVTAPLLVGLGFSPIMAVTAPSIGHAWAVTFGSLASSFQALIAASGIPGESLAALSALLLGLAGFGCGIAVAAVMEGWSGVRRLLIPILLIGTVMGGVQIAVVTSGAWALGAMMAGLAGMAISVILARMKRDRSLQGDTSYHALAAWAFSPYALLIVLTLAVQGIPSIKQALSVVILQGGTPRMETALGFISPASAGKEIAVLRHAGAILLYTSLISYGVFRLSGNIERGSIRVIAADMLRKVLPSSVAIFAMVSMSVVMAHSGMTRALAEGLASLAGDVVPFVSVWIGALGAFMTGSNTNSNVLFALLQRDTANLLSLPVSLMLAAQTTGAALGSIISPTKIVVGASTTGMQGQEGGILRVLLRYMLPMLLGLGLLVQGLVCV